MFEGIQKITTTLFRSKRGECMLEEYTKPENGTFIKDIWEMMKEGNKGDGG